MRMWMWTALLTACGGSTPDDTYEPPTTTFDQDSDRDTGDTAAPVDFAEPPTDVDAECWAWVVDTDIDGLLSGTTLRVYDPAYMNLTHYERDYEPDGILDYVADYTYTANGEDSTGTTVDSNGDGTPDSLTTVSFDADGQRTRYATDTDGDGSWEEVWTYEYAGGLRMIAYVDEGDDGTTDLWYRYAYDANDRRQGVEVDRDDDGTIDMVYRYTYFDETGPDYLLTLDDDNDGDVEVSWEYRYDADERLTFYESLEEAGEFSTYTYTYTADGDVASQSGTVKLADQDAYDFESAYTYVAPKRIDTTSSVYDFGGASFQIDQAYAWTCP